MEALVQLEDWPETPVLVSESCTDISDNFIAFKAVERTGPMHLPPSPFDFLRVIEALEECPTKRFGNPRKSITRERL